MAEARTERLFLAVELPDEVRRELGRLRDEYPRLRDDLRWARPEGLHITLRFLGDTTPDRRDALAAGLRAAELGADFALSCRGVGIFGSVGRHDAVLWAGLEGDTARLERLATRVVDLCARLGWPPEDRPFRPHVTLARARGGGVRDPDALRRLLDRHAATAFGRFEVGEVVLLRSELGPGGARYSSVARRALG